MPCRRAYQLYCQAANITLPVGKSLLNKAMIRALKDGVLLLEREHGTVGFLDEIVRTPGTPVVRLRAVGPRKLADIPQIGRAHV